MAQVDTSIYNALLQRPKSAFEWQNEYAAQDDAAQARQMNALNMREAQARAGDAATARQDQWTVRNALAGMQPDAPLQDRAKALRGTGTPMGYTQAQEIEKADQEAAKVRAQTLQAQNAAQHSQEQTKAAQLKAESEKHDRAIGEIMSFQSPQEAMESLRRHAAEGSIGQAEVQAMSRQLMGLATPEQWQQWQDQTLYKLQDAKGKADLQFKRLEWQAKQRESASTLANRDLIEDPSRPGQFVVNAPLNAAKVQRANAGASVTYGSPIQVDIPGIGPALVQPGNRGGPAQVMRLPTGEMPRPVAKPAAPLPNTVVKGLTEARDNAESIGNLSASFMPAYAGKGVVGVGADAQMAVSGTLGADKDAVEWWKNYRKNAELVERHALFGAALTPGEQASWRSADVGPGMNADVIARNLTTRATLARKVLDNAREDAISSGHDAERVTQIANRTAKPANKAGYVPDDIKALLQKHGGK